MKSMKQLLAEQVERDDRRRMAQYLDLFAQYQDHLTSDRMFELFSLDVGTHLWSRYSGYRYNLPYFYATLDKNNRKIISDDIAAFERQQKSTGDN